MSIQESTRGPVDRVQIARYAGAVDDYNPVHVDEEFAKAAGLPSVIAHGPLTIALALDAVVAQVGPTALRSATARLSAPVFPGDVLLVAPTGAGVEVSKSDGTIVATVSLTLSPPAPDGAGAGASTS